MSFPNIIVHPPRPGGEVHFGDGVRLTLGEPYPGLRFADEETVRRACLDWPGVGTQAAFAHVGAVHILNNPFAPPSGAGGLGYNYRNHIFTGSHQAEKGFDWEGFWASVVGHELGHAFEGRWMTAKLSARYYALRSGPMSVGRPQREWFAEDWRCLMGGPLVSRRPHEAGRRVVTGEVGIRVKAILQEAVARVWGAPEATEIRLTVGSAMATINGWWPVDLLAAPVNLNGRVMVGIRDIGTLFGCEVAWDEAMRTVTIRR